MTAPKPAPVHTLLVSLECWRPSSLSTARIPADLCDFDGFQQFGQEPERSQRNREIG
ncbi:hypothetical protein [Enhygromyxa salina]|uniref:hypothetical protein n=1 Tax=Enhygromyxa salina TaxID=215803 RepID=UPI0012934F62|nr:hypothetical protein [Enhygromyxa salina]